MANGASQGNRFTSTSRNAEIMPRCHDGKSTLAESRMITALTGYVSSWGRMSRGRRCRACFKAPQNSDEPWGTLHSLCGACAGQALAGNYSPKFSLNSLRSIPGPQPVTLMEVTVPHIRANGANVRISNVVRATTAQHLNQPHQTLSQALGPKPLPTRPMPRGAWFLSKAEPS